ncbi:MAG: preQ(1) synthase [Ignavibacteria bacterium]|jgi:7-cyano-7-deazaguanine reductase|nr:preQ(1) synthase [Ignavibacteria bacterium]MDP3830956.1 preQ(1) synthase [Ignavibacteriaceae bacterium]
MNKKQKLLVTFPNPKPERNYIIEHVQPEFTSVCPVTGQPDFAKITLSYIPDNLCVELKSYKFYLQSYRNDGIYFEAVTNKILDDLVEVIQPRTMRLIAEFNVRGGISSLIEAEYQSPEFDDVFID